jgi:hypothetical protein
MVFIFITHSMNVISIFMSVKIYLHSICLNSSKLILCWKRRVTCALLRSIDFSPV